MAERLPKAKLSQFVFWVMFAVRPAQEAGVEGTPRGGEANVMVTRGVSEDGTSYGILSSLTRRVTRAPVWISGEQNCTVGTMKAFTKHTGLAAPMDRSNVDTDQIIPKQFLKRIERTGFGKFLFFDWRFEADGSEKPDFVLNQPAYRKASVLVARQNFGNGSSREHAVWALDDFGFRCVIAESFADIFYNNCSKNGVLPVVLTTEQVEQLHQKIAADDSYQVTVDLEANIVTDESGFSATFEIDDFRRKCFLEGLDQIGLTLTHEDKIAKFESQRA